MAPENFEELYKSLTYSDVSIFFVLFVVSALCILVAKKASEYLLNVALSFAISRVAPDLFGELLSIQLGFNSIALNNISMSQKLVASLNKGFHDSCHFNAFEIDSCRVQVVPYIRVEVRGVRVQLLALPPDQWSADSIVSTLRMSRSKMFDILTDRIQWRRKNRKLRAILGPLVTFVLSFADMILSSAHLHVFDVSVGYLLNRRINLKPSSIAAKLGKLRVWPMLPSFDYFFASGMTMNYEIVGLTIVCEDAGPVSSSIESRQLPLLDPAFVSGSIRLPKIVSRMIQADPLESKFGHLVVDAENLVVNGTLENMIALSDFSIMIDTYRKWYSCVENTFEKRRETANDVMFTYITAYLKYTSETSVNKKSELRKLYHSLEEQLCDDDIRLSRSLVLGWYATDVLLLKKFKEDANFKLFETFKSNDAKMVQYKSVLKNKYENELLSFKELRKMKVDINANSIFINMPCFRAFAAGRPATEYRRTTLFIHGMKMHITEPIVKMSEQFDEPRILKGSIKRMIISNTSCKITDQAVINLDVVCTSIPLVDRINFAAGDSIKKPWNSAILEPEPPPDTINMISFHVVENIWNHEVSVRAGLWNAVVVPNVYHGLDLAEYALVVVEDIAHIYSYYVTECQLPSAVAPFAALPSSLLQGQILKIDVSANNLCVLFTDKQNNDDLIPQCLVLSLDAVAKISSSPTNESIEANLPLLQLLTCEKPPCAHLRGIMLSDLDKVHKLTVCVCPSATRIQYNNLTFTYRLDKRRDTPHQVVYPDVPEADLTRLHAPSANSNKSRSLKKKNMPNTERIENQSQRIDYWRWAGATKTQGPNGIAPHSTKDQEQVMMLIRDVQILGSPIEVCISECESQILAQWCKTSIKAVFPHLLGCESGKERLKSERISCIQMARVARDSMRKARLKADEEQYLEVKFRAFDLSGDGCLEPFELKTIISKILAPLHLLRHELDQKILDILFVLDYDLDGKISLAEFRQNLIAVDRTFLNKGNIILLAGEIVGSRVPDYITRGAHLDSAASRKLWDLIEREMGIMYSDRDLGGNSPYVVQSMLIRLCGDLKLAQLVWDNVIRPNIRDFDTNLYAYPWMISSDEAVGGDVDIKTLARQFFSKPKLNLMGPETSQNTADLIACSYTKIRLQMSTVAVNIVDNFLGPTVPRFQFQMDELFVAGEILNEGIRPHWTTVSKDAVGIISKLRIQSSFFNSLVQQHEPIVEPWEMTCMVRKEESNGYLDCLIKGDYVNINLSTACLQTLASSLMNVVSIKSTADGVILTERLPPMLKSYERLDEAQLSRIKQFDSAKMMRDHYCLIVNLAGCPLGFVVSAPHVQKNVTEIFVKQETSKYITIPLLNASNRVKGSNFAHLVVNTYLEDSTITYVQDHPVPLHLLALNSIAIHPVKCKNNGELLYQHREKSFPALILDMETGGDGARDFYSNSTLTARSNVKIRNCSDQLICVRLVIADVTENNSARLDTTIGVNDVFYIPLYFVSYLKSLMLSTKPVGDKESDNFKWLPSVNVESLLSQEEDPISATNNSPFLYSAHSFHMLNTMAVCGTSCPLYDHTIDIISGLRVINALPFDVAVKTKIWDTCDNESVGSNHLPRHATNRFFSIRSGGTIWLPVNSSKQVKIRFNITSNKHKLNGEGSSSSSRTWSEPIHFNSKRLESQFSIVVPAIEKETAVNCNVLLTTDMAPVDNSIDVHYAPTVYIFSDIWVQNNSSISLRYKFDRSTLERSVIASEDDRIALGLDVNVNDTNHLSNMTALGEAPCLGPILAPLGTKHLFVEVWKSGTQIEYSPALREFTNLVQVLPRSNSRNFWSEGLTMVNGHTGEIRTCSIWLGYLVRQGSGLFSKTLIVTITPRYVIQNKTNLPVSIFSTLVSRMSFTNKSRIRETDQIWEEAELARKGHARVDGVIRDVDFQQSVHHDRSWFTQQSSTHDDVNSDAMLFAEAVLEKRKRRKSSILGKVGATKGVSQGWLEETRQKSDGDNNSYTPDDSEGLPEHVSVRSGEFASLEPAHCAAMYSFGEETALPKLFTQSMCISVGNPKANASRNYILLKIISANNIAVANSNGFSDPFCNIYWQGELLYRTRDQKNTLNPYWQESFILTLPKEDMSSLELRIEVMDHNISRQNIFLGQVTLRSNDLLYNAGNLQSYELRENSSSDSKGVIISGSIAFSVAPVSRKDVHPWTPPLRLDIPGIEYISARMANGFAKLLFLSVISSGPVMIVSICEHTEESLPAFRIENRTPDLRLRFRQSQTDKIDYVRRTLRPAEGCYYGWDDPNLPHAVELVVVDCNDVESQIVSYKIDSIDESLPQINTTGMSTKSAYLQVKIHIRGHIRILSVSSAAASDLEADTDDGLGVFAGYLLHASIDMSFLGLSISAIDDTPHELFNFVVEGVRITSLAESPVWTASLMHLQLDNMMDKSKYPVMICPLDSGFNSERNPYFFHLGGNPIPLIEINFEPDWYAPIITDATIIRALELRVRPLNVIVDLNFIVRLIKAMLTRRILGTVGVLCDMLWPRNISCSNFRDFLINATPFPKSDHVHRTVFIKSMILHSMAFQILLSIQMDKMEMDQNRDLSTLTENSRAIRYLVELSRSVTVINPKFDFFGVKLDNAFDHLDAIMWRIAFVYISQAILQSYKIFGSMDAIGDPVGVIKDLSTSLKSFVIHSGLELSGQTPFRAEGLKHLMQGIIGSPFGSLAKVSRGFGQFLGNLSNLDIDLGQESAPAHVGEGIFQAGKVFTESIHQGVVNVVKHPYKGIKEGNALHTVRGAAQGVLGLVLSPAIGVFGAVAKLTQSIDSTTHVFDKQLRGRMRPNRPLFHNPVVRTLRNTILYESFTFRITNIEIPLLQFFSGHFMCITVRYGNQYFATTAKSCASALTWAGTDAIFQFPAKPYGASFANKMLIFKFKLMEHETTPIGKALTIARGEIHPLDMGDYFTRHEQLGVNDCENYDTLSMTSLTFASDDKCSSQAHSTSTGVNASRDDRARGPEKVSLIKYNLFAMSRRISSQYGKGEAQHLDISHDSLSKLSKMSQITSAGSIDSLIPMIKREDILSGHSPATNQLLPAVSPLRHMVDSYDIDFQVNTELLRELSLNRSGIPNPFGMENIQDALQNDMHICMMSISGSFVSAIKDTARFAEAMLSKPAVDTPDIFAPISHDNGDHIYL